MAQFLQPRFLHVALSLFFLFGTSFAVVEARADRDSALMAANSKKKKKRPKHVDSSLESTDGTDEPAKSANLYTPAIRGLFGIVQGLKLADSTVFVFGGDLMYPLGTALTLEGGMLYFSASKESETSLAQATVMDFSGGSMYHLPVSPSLTVDVGGRVGMASLKTTFSTSLFGSDVATSNSYSSLHLDFAGGITAHFGAFMLGGELRYPLMFFNSKDFKEITPMFLMATAGIKF